MRSIGFNSMLKRTLRRRDPQPLGADKLTPVVLRWFSCLWLFWCGRSFFSRLQSQVSTPSATGTCFPRVISSRALHPRSQSCLNSLYIYIFIYKRSQAHNAAPSIRQRHLFGIHFETDPVRQRRPRTVRTLRRLLRLGDVTARWVTG